MSFDKYFKRQLANSEGLRPTRINWKNRKRLKNGFAYSERLIEQPLRDLNRVSHETASDEECLDAFMKRVRLEGIILALESAHAIACAMCVAPEMSKDTDVVAKN